RIYLDYASTTPIDKRVIREMKGLWANPSSIHKEGILAKKKLEKARKRVARIMKIKTEEVIFTSGGTGSVNLAILGVVRNFENPHIITSTIEHSAVLETCKYLEKNNLAEVSYASVDGEGLVSPKEIESLIKENTVLISIMYVNNEIGTIQPISEISKIIPRNVYFHTDASQAPNYLDIHMERLGVDMMAIDGSKVYGPRGIGVLAVKKDVKMSPILFGGGQEKGLRPGTENLPAICGLAKALEISNIERKKESERLLKIRDWFVDELKGNFPDCKINGSLKKRIPNNVNICFPKIDSEFLVIRLDQLGFATSFASSCQSDYSYVVSKVSGEECGKSSLRISFGRDTNKRKLKRFIGVLKKILV
ncbi:MAG: cysteine desulfurase, partial [Candidatus Pacebacteria bacterium]|nr:cysteine desulfurase [Candidatus Paceibacterota bacterium]